ncbi:hypothetical protein KGM_210688 [Danaus plexippus plexippus]|uniref:Uncharacterized protein n=1 Tax=Danaus plexippus plexippus TaxID=278856 RepID=A0A212FN72_DANPL|nr:hypothetical protein KGM_210688 [Danaus plexippus plexippus]
MTTKNIWFALMLIPTVFGVDLDYLSPVLREQTLVCQSILQRLHCHLKCGEKKAICLKDKCFCVPDVIAREFDSSIIVDSGKEDGVIDYIDSEDNEGDETRIDNVPFYAMRPTVRHHIAHFCPNLDIARECIKKCMTEGKPAFCGKDHVCYCGHKYTTHDNNSKVDAKAMYAQFHDLYAKYFGAEKSSNEKDSVEA